MKIIIIFWPPAVWKYTVWKKLWEKIWYPFFHNHAINNMLLPIFWDKNISDQNLNNKIRLIIIKKAISQWLNWLIFTICWAFNDKKDNKLIKDINRLFEEKDVFYIELFSDIKTRLKRNKTEPRISEKLTKQNINISERKINDFEKQFIMNSSNKYDFWNKQHLFINNQKISIENTVNKIIKHFNLI